MSTNAQISGHPSRRIPERRLWFGACGAAVAWALHGFTCFLISTQACQDGRGDLGPLPAGAVRVVLGFVTLGLLGVAVAAGLVSYSNWRRLSEQRSLLEDQALGREDFMALVGIFVSAAFIVGIIWAGIPLIVIDVCVNAR